MQTIDCKEWGGCFLGEYGLTEGDKDRQLEKR